MKLKMEPHLAKIGFSSLFLAVLKFTAFLASGSVIVLASFLDSLIDSLVSSLNAFIHHSARKRPDVEHPFGHGGIEVISSMMQGLLIAGSAVVVFYESFVRITSKDLVQEIMAPREVAWSVGVLLFSACIGGLFSRYLGALEQRLSLKNDRSLSVTADRGHYVGDLWTNLFAAIGLALVWYSNIPELDSFFGVIGGVLLIKVSFPILKKTVSDILHTGAEPTFQKEIVDIIYQVDDRIKGVHRLRVRHLGPIKFLDFHLKLPADLLLKAAHDIGESVRISIQRKIPHVDVVIHLDPDDEPDDDLWTPVYVTKAP
ncbi:MAG: cation diffusion facilitator family transporter [Oligoflexales bacterium]